MECQHSLAIRKVSIRPSVSLSNACIVRKWKKDLSRSLYHTRDHLASFLRRMVGGGDPFYVKFWVSWPRWSKIADFKPILARSASAVTRSEKSSINTNRKSSTRFPMSLRWSSYVVAPKPPKRGSKTQNGRFPCKVALRLKKVCYKISLCKNDKGCKAYIGLSVQKWLLGDVLCENSMDDDHSFAMCQFFYLFLPVVPQP